MFVSLFLWVIHWLSLSRPVLVLVKFLVVTLLIFSPLSSYFKPQPMDMVENIIYFWLLPTPCILTSESNNINNNLSTYCFNHNTIRELFMNYLLGFDFDSDL